LNVVVVIIVMAWMLNAFRIFGPQSSIHIGSLHMWW
jgi:hypothetical protein